MKFTVEVEIGNDGMRRYDSIRAAIKEAMMPVRLARNTRNINTPHEGDSGKIMDVNGNCVGTWQVLNDKPMPQATCHSCGKAGHKQPACTEVPTIYPK